MFRQKRKPKTPRKLRVDNIYVLPSYVNHNNFNKIKLHLNILNLKILILIVKPLLYSVPTPFIIKYGILILKLSSINVICQYIYLYGHHIIALFIFE